MKKKRSLFNSLIIPLILILIMQSGAFIVAIYGSGTVSSLRESSMQLLYQYNRSRGDYLENEMTSRWMNLTQNTQEINRIVENTIYAKNETFETFISCQREENETDLEYNTRYKKYTDINTDVINSINSELKRTIRNNSVNGVFVTFGLNDDSNKYGLYIRDDGPEIIDAADYVVEIAPVGFDYFGEYSRSNYYKTKFEFAGESDPNWLNFYDKPVSTALENSTLDQKYLGWWNSPYHLNNPEYRMLSYSLPLISTQGVCYGVLGVEITENKILSLLSTTELTSTQEGVYLMGTANGETIKQIDSFFTCGNNQAIEGLNKDNCKITPTSNSDVFYIEFDGNGRYYSICSLDVYSANTPFVSQEWVLAAIVYEDFVLAKSLKLQRTLSVVTSLTFIVGVVALTVTCFFLVRPISLLTDKMKKLNASVMPALSPLGILEIDELIESIGELETRVNKTQNKISQVIELSKMDMAYFEFDLGTDELFVSDNFKSFVNLDCEMPKSAKSFVKEMNENFLKLTEEVSDEDSIIYSFHDKDGKKRWIEVRSIHDSSNDQHMLSVLSDVTDTYLERERLRHELELDRMTGLYNRRAFENKMDDLFEKNKDQSIFKYAVFIMLDLDNLKYINDTYGHDTGDEYIMKTSEIMRQALDHEEKKVYGRRSGDEFYIFLYDNDLEKLKEKIKLLRQYFEKSRFTCPNEEVTKIRISGGISVYPIDSTTTRELIKFADYAMYDTKATSKGSFHFFNYQSYKRNAFNLGNNEAMLKMIEEDKIDYHFQPIVDLATGEIFGYEALMRPISKIFKSPTDVINTARANGKLEVIESITVNKALEIFKEKQDLFKSAKLFINSLPNLTLSRSEENRINTKYAELLKRCVFEITEDDPSTEDLLNKKIESIYRSGAKLAIDDYGVGYNGEVRIMQIKPDYIKLDITLVRDVDLEVNKQKLLKSIIDFAHEQGSVLIAEGVENFGELKMLKELNCDYVQGFWLGRPQKNPQDIDETKKEMIKKLALEK